MRELNRASTASRVTALFETGALSFPMPAGTTLEELAHHFEHLAARTNSKPIAITVKLAPAIKQ